MAILQQQRELFMQLSHDASAAPAAKGGIKHINYLITHWMLVALWKSWSEWGRVAASTVLNIPSEGVIPTTNHLESFNSILKRKHLPAHLRSGHRLRFDSLIHILITQILPGIYRHRQAQKEYRQWLETRFRASAGGENLFEIHKAVLNKRALKDNKPVCWWEVDVARDKAALEILNSHRLSISRGNDKNTFDALCTRSSPNCGPDTAYSIKISRTGLGSCTCPDFLARGGACKHLRATRLTIDFWVREGHVAAFHYPTSRVDGEQLLLQLHSQPNIKHSIELLLNPNPPDDVAPASIMWDPTIIQTLGLDQTTLDDQEEDVEGSISGESALSESEVGCSSYEGSTPTPICLLQPDTVVCTPFHSLYLPIS
jgi:hypothetical protein